MTARTTSAHPRSTSPQAEAVVWPDLPEMPRASLPTHMAPLAAADVPWDTDPAAFEPGRRGRPSAVVLLFLPPERPGEAARLLLMRRSTKVRSHRGQVGLAGG